MFDPFPAHLSFEETDFGLGAISAVNPGTALQNLSSFGDISHATFGEMQLETPPLVARFALLEVFSPAGELVTARVLPLDGAPPAGEQLWRPAEFLLQVTAVGVVGEPVLLQGSGSEAVDLFLRDSIRRLSRLRMLDPGYYRVLGGP